MDGVGEAYGAVADRYIGLFGHATSVHADDLALIEHHFTGGAGPVLDLGCGPGHLTAHLMNRGTSCLGIDITPAFLQHARTSLGVLDMLLGSLDSLPLRRSSVAGVLAWYSLIHVPPRDLDDALAELRRVTAGGATVVVGFFDGDDVEDFAHKVTTAFTWPVDELSIRLARAGFDEIDRLARPADPQRGIRPHAAIVAVAQ